jgi:hypothetical protein
MKTRVQAAKKMGELKKRFSTRISHLRKEKEAVHMEKETKSLQETVKSTKSPPTPGKNTKRLKSLFSVLYALLLPLIVLCL